MDQRSSSTKLSTDEQLIMVIPETQLSDNTQHVPPPLNAELAIAHKSAENDFPPTHTHTHTQNVGMGPWIVISMTSCLPCILYCMLSLHLV